MVTDEQLAALAARLVEVPGVVAVSLGGSRARGDHTPESDVDLGLYYRPPLDLEALGRLAREVAGVQAQVTAPGEWGPWVDGGSWPTIEGTAVDWLYRDVDRVRASWSTARRGRYGWHASVSSDGLLATCQRDLQSVGVPKSITIRDVPDDTSEELAARAAATGRSLQEYLRARLVEFASTPDADVLLARIRSRKAATSSTLDAEKILAHRDADRR